MTQINRTRRYRPGSASEGDAFEAAWCQKCKRDKRSNPCRIYLDVNALRIDDPAYPRQWITDNDGPRCTAFDPKNPPTEADRKYLAWRQANGSQG